MDDLQLWNTIYNAGILPYGWWYGGAVLLATVLAGCLFPFVWYVLTRRDETLLTLLRWLFVSTLPFVCVFPSYWAHVALSRTLGWVWLSPPTTISDLSPENLQQIGSYLNTLAILGIFGGLLALVIAGAMTVRLLHGPLGQQLLPNLSGSEKFETEKIGPRPEDDLPGSGTMKREHGVVRITRGARRENVYSIFPQAVIGKQEATIPITDKIVSRRHARFEVHGEQTCIVDLGSENGTYVQRGESCFRITDKPFPLEHYDQIFLGHPSGPLAVELIFEQVPRQINTGRTTQPVDFSDSL
jgi:FHA domain